MTRRLRGVVPALTALVMAAAPAGAAYEEVEVLDGGTLSGVVRFAGTPPELPPIPVNKNRDVCGERKPSEALVLGPDRGVKGSVVLLEGVARGKKAAGEVLVDNAKCLFVSHVTGAMAGAKAKVKNSDAILHNTHGFLDRLTVFNLALPNKDQVVDITRRLTRPGVVKILCDAHPHMFAWLVVHDSPYITVTDDQGAFRIDDIPPGTYRVRMWHEGFRLQGLDKDGRPTYDEPRAVSRDVTISPKGTATVEFELK